MLKALEKLKNLFSFLLLSILSLGYVYSQKNISDNEVFQLKDDTVKVNMLNGLAENLINNQPAKAKEFAAIAYNISDSLNYGKGLAKSAYYIGLSDSELGNYASSLHYFNISLENYEKIGEKPAIGNIYNKIGNIHLQQGNYVAALENYFTSLEISDELKDSVGISATYNNIGIIHHEQFEQEEALKYYYSSIKIDSLLNNRNGLAKTLMNAGAVYMDMADYKSALELYNKSLDIFIQFNDKINMAGCYNNIAAVHHELENYRLALENYFKALEIYKEVGSMNGVASTCYSIGAFYNSNREYSKAITYLDKALTQSKDLGILKIESNAALALSESHYNLGDYKKAYLYHVYFKQLSDLLKNEENVKRITKLQMQYEFDQLQKEEDFKRMQREIKMKQQKLYIVFLGIGLFLMITLAFLIYRNYRIKKRDNILLARQKEEIEKQRDEIEEQRDEIRAQRDLATQQRDQITKQKQEITDSILYAKKIQSAVLPPKEYIDKFLTDYFIFYKPRDIVSGDFYWINEVQDKIILAAADCTGHGVPGAFMSMLGISFLNETIRNIKQANAGLILDNLRSLVIKSLHQKGKADEAKDGMDISLAVIDKENMMLQYAGAYNSLYVIRNDQLIEIKPNRMPIGIFLIEQNKFTNHDIELKKGDCLYMFSDGFSDQFGGPDLIKFKTKNFKNLLLEISKLSMDEQYGKLEKTFVDWKGDAEQIDDILVIGLRM